MKSLKVALVLVSAAVAAVLGAAPASADVHAVIHVQAKAPVVTGSLKFESDSLPVSCRIVVRNLDSFGSVAAAARVFTTSPGTVSKSLGGFEPGDRVRVEGTCSDRSGDVFSGAANGWAT